MSLSYYQIIMPLFYFPKDYMPFSDIYVSTFKNDTEYRQLLIQTAMALQTNKFIQVRVTRNRCWKKAALNLIRPQTSWVNLKPPVGFLSAFDRQWQSHEAKPPLTVLHVRSTHAERLQWPIVRLTLTTVCVSFFLLQLVQRLNTSKNSSHRFVRLVAASFY